MQNVAWGVWRTGREMSSEQRSFSNRGSIYVQSSVSDSVPTTHSDSVLEAGSSVNLLETGCS